MRAQPRTCIRSCKKRRSRWHKSFPQVPFRIFSGSNKRRLPPGQGKRSEGCAGTHLWSSGVCISATSLAKHMRRLESQDAFTFHPSVPYVTTPTVSSQGRGFQLEYFSKAASNFSFAKHCVLPLCQFPSDIFEHVWGLCARGGVFAGHYGTTIFRH